MTSAWRRCVAESLGTFAMVFAGTGAIVVNDVSGGAISHVGVSMTFGLIVTVMIYSIGELSGAHINPAVSVGFAVAGRFEPGRVFPYICSQLAGALAASLLLRAMFPQHATLGATLPAGAPLQAFLMEVILTWLLMLVILCVTTGSRETGQLAGLAIGGTVLLEALFGGPVSGASMNPARSIGPALVSGNLQHLWIYIAAPLLGVGMAVACWRVLRPELHPAREAAA